MRTLTLVVSLAALLAVGCSSAYRPLDGNEYGYREVQLAPGTYQVEYIANHSVAPDDANLFVLYRAAQLAQQQGFSHFAVVERDSRLYSNADFSWWRPTVFELPSDSTPSFFRRSEPIPQVIVGIDPSGAVTMQPVGHAYRTDNTPRDTRFRAVAKIELRQRPNGNTYEVQKVLKELAPTAGKKVIL